MAALNPSRNLNPSHAQADLDGHCAAAPYFNSMARFAQILLVAGLLLGWSQPTSARGAVSTSVKIKVIKLARKGKRAFLAKRYDDALGHWQQAYGLWPKPQLLYNIALAHSRASRPVRAMSFLRAFFTEAKSQRQKRGLMRRARKLERSLQPQVAVLEISGPKGAEVFLNDKRAGTVPVEAVLRPGPHRLELRAKGRIAVSRTLWLPSGRTTALHIQMRLAPQRPVARRPGPGSGSPGDDAGPQKGLHMAYSLGAAGVALALAGIAVGTGMLAIKRYDEFQANPTSTTRARVKTLQDATNGLWGVAGAVGVAAVVLAIFTRWRQRRESAAHPAPRVELGVGPTALGVSVQGGF